MQAVRIVGNSLAKQTNEWMNERAERNITSSGCFYSQLLNLMKTIWNVRWRRGSPKTSVHTSRHRNCQKKIWNPKDRQENTEYEIFNFSFHLIFRAILSFCLFVGHFFTEPALYFAQYISIFLSIFRNSPWIFDKYS